MSNAPTHIKFARAIAQLGQAASNLSDVSAECGDEGSRRASRVIMMLKNAMIHGSSYKVASASQEFDYHMEQQSVGK